MRIISKFHDYYDVVQATGQDQTLIYNREPKQILWEHKNFTYGKKLDKNWPFPLITSSPLSEIKHIYGAIIGFCGKIYPCVRLHFGYNEPLKIIRCFNADEIHDFVEQHASKKELNSYNDGKPGWRTSPYTDWYGETFYYFDKRKNIDNYFIEFQKIQNNFVHLFADNQSPQFVTEDYNSGHAINFNASLKEQEFYRVIDPFTAFQEISMYWGGIAHPEKPLPHIPDKVMVEAKGFDKKWSFRKRPNNG